MDIPHFRIQGCMGIRRDWPSPHVGNRWFQRLVCSTLYCLVRRNLTNTIHSSAMSFLLSSGGVDQVQEWESLTASQRSTIKSQYNAAGIALVASAFGSTEKRMFNFHGCIVLTSLKQSFTATSSGESASSLGTSMGQWVLDNGVDGAF